VVLVQGEEMTYQRKEGRYIYIPAAKTKSTAKKAIFMEDFSISSGAVNS